MDQADEGSGAPGDDDALAKATGTLLQAHGTVGEGPDAVKMTALHIRGETSPAPGPSRCPRTPRRVACPGRPRGSAPGSPPDPRTPAASRRSGPGRSRQ